MNNMYTVATGYPGKACETQSKDQHHREFLDLFPKGKLREAVRFVCARETGIFLQPEKLASYKMGTID